VHNEVYFKVLEHYPSELGVLTRGSEHAVGFDLRSAEEDTVHLDPGEHKIFNCGIVLELPPHLEAQVRPRSGLANNKHLIIPNSPGTVDPDYRGEIKVGLFNIGKETQYVVRGERIAQIVFSKVEDITLYQTTEVKQTERGSDGFGSTGSV